MIKIRRFSSILLLLALSCFQATVYSASTESKKPGSPAIGRTCDPELTTSQINTINLQPILTTMSVSKAVQLIPIRSDESEWYVVAHEGLIYHVRQGVKRVFLDMSDRVHMGSQWGVQEVAFHPDFPADPRLFVTYSGYGSDHSKDKPSFESRLSVFWADSTGKNASVSSEVILLEGRQRFGQNWHPIAGLKFGPDGLLYIGWGEGGGATLKPELPNGKMLRVDVGPSSQQFLTVPDDNPFTDSPRPETFARGLRNPWRFSFDRYSHDLWLGDVGSRLNEEVNVVERGGHYGWPHMEGDTCLQPGSCNSELLLPRIKLSRGAFCSVTGGYVYRGEAMPQLYGKYIYADYCSGSIWSSTLEQPGRQQLIYSTPKSMNIASFSEDSAGELYIVTAVGSSQPDRVPRRYHSKFFRVVANTKSTVEPLVSKRRYSLRESGCISSDDYTSPPQGFSSYQVSVPPFDSGASVHRFFSTSRKISLYDWVDKIPLGKLHEPILLKTYAVDDAPVETQLSVKGADGNWHWLQYAWNADGTDAELVDKAFTRKLPNGHYWPFGGSASCTACHSNTGNDLLGFTMSQLNIAVESGEGHKESQLNRFEEAGTMTLRSHLRVSQPLPSPNSGVYSKSDLARSYLDANCSACHQPTGSASFLGIDFRFQVKLSKMNMCGVEGISKLGGQKQAFRLAPGRPEESILVDVMQAVDDGAMPPGRSVIDQSGVELVKGWVEGLDNCQSDSGHTVLEFKKRD